MMSHVRRRGVAIAATLSLFAPANMALGQESTPPVAETELPDGKTLVETALKKMGGAEEVASIKSFQCTVKSRVFEQSPTAEIVSVTVFAILPDHFKLLGTVAQGEPAEFVFNGKHTWVREPGTGTYGIQSGGEQMFVPMMGPQIRALRLAGFETAETVADGTFADTDMYAVSVSFPDVDRRATYYIEKETGELFGFESPVDAIGATMKTTIHEWTEVDGVRMISRIRFHPGGPNDIEVTFEEFKLNSVGEAAFALPDRVKELIGDHENTGDGVDQGDDGDETDSGDGARRQSPR